MFSTKEYELINVGIVTHAGETRLADGIHWEERLDVKSSDIVGQFREKSGGRRIIELNKDKFTRATVTELKKIGIDLDEGPTFIKTI